MKRIYLDYASLTPIDPRVLREVKRFSAREFANPSSLYKEGVAAKKSLERSRNTVAGFIHAHADEIVFTSGGTEANGLALEGSARAAYRAFQSAGVSASKLHMVVSAIEHSSIIETASMMEKQGVEVTRIGVDRSGVISIDELKKAIKPNTFLVSIMTVNNEIGAVQPIREIAKAIRQTKERTRQYPLFHTDAAQASLYFGLNVEKLGVDMLTLDGSKVYGPRGIGALYVRRGTPIEPIIYGGGQERGMRSGTENIPMVGGFAKALEIAGKERDKEVTRIQELKEKFLAGLLMIRPDITVNGEIAASPHISNLSIPGIDNEFFVIELDAKGIAVSTKSSCLRDEDESYVLKAIGAHSKTAVRFSFGRWTRKSDIDKVLKTVSRILTNNR
jgi:cysteine desulfurase